MLFLPVKGQLFYNKNYYHYQINEIKVDSEYRQNIDTKTIHITQVYNRDHRPDLNPVVLNLIT